MMWYICLGVLAAFGALSALWCCLGWCVPGASGGVLVCRCRNGSGALAFLRRCSFLRGAGLLKCPVLLVDDGLDPRERQALERRGVEICSLEALPARLELER